MKQTYQNHRQYVPGWHFITSFLIFLCVAGAVTKLFYHTSDNIDLHADLLLTTISLVLALMFYYIRSFALKAQDRAIRAEENLRHFILTGYPLDPRLGLRQIIALRFASDGEFPHLARKAAELSLSASDIKKSIRSWRGDNNRV